MIYKAFNVSYERLDKALNDLAEVGWRLHSTQPVINSASVLVIMQIEKGKA